MANAAEALKITRTLLNDDGSMGLSDEVLLPKLRQAHLELQSKIALNGLSVERDLSSQTTISANATTWAGPLNLISPSKMFEKGVGDTDDQFILMTRQDFPPYLQKETNLRYWCWRNNAFQFIGATSDRIVQLRYIGGLTTPSSVQDDLGLTFAEIFIGPRVAALLAVSMKDYDAAQSFQSIADTNLSQVIRTLVKGDEQPLPVRRRPFSFRLRRGRDYFF